ncbi:hypothetical protein NC651_008292 [Populus alba x Populus x berolinensis]|nr:hypothetical protein NC651_008292 [Populus alba x Populus x berolinensis]
MRLGSNENNVIIDNGDINGGARGLNGKLSGGLASSLICLEVVINNGD